VFAEEAVTVGVTRRLHISNVQRGDRIAEKLAFHPLVGTQYVAKIIQENLVL